MRLIRVPEVFNMSPTQHEYEVPIGKDNLLLVNPTSEEIELLHAQFSLHPGIWLEPQETGTLTIFHQSIKKVQELRFSATAASINKQQLLFITVVRKSGEILLMERYPLPLYHRLPQDNQMIWYTFQKLLEEVHSHTPVYISHKEQYRNRELLASIQRLLDLASQGILFSLDTKQKHEPGPILRYLSLVACIKTLPDIEEAMRKALEERPQLAILPEWDTFRIRLEDIRAKIGSEEANDVEQKYRNL